MSKVWLLVAALATVAAPGLAAPAAAQKTIYLSSLVQDGKVDLQYTYLVILNMLPKSDPEDEETPATCTEQNNYFNCLDVTVTFRDLAGTSKASKSKWLAPQEQWQLPTESANGGLPGTKPSDGYAEITCTLVKKTGTCDIENLHPWLAVVLPVPYGTDYLRPGFTGTWLAR